MARLNRCSKVPLIARLHLQRKASRRPKVGIGDAKRKLSGRIRSGLRGPNRKARHTGPQLYKTRPSLGADYISLGFYVLRRLSSSGVENYLLGIKPIVVRTFLRLGGAHVDKEKELDELQVTAEKGQLLKPFARLLLAVAALRDRDFAKASRLLQGLTEKFPGNPLYSQELAKLESRPS